MKKRKRSKKARAIRAMRHHQAVLASLGLPINLIELIRSGRLEEEVLKARAENEKLNALLDEWELKNPAAYRLAPWYDAREAWKARGRPEPAWYELLSSYRNRAEDKRHRTAPLGANELCSNILGIGAAEHLRRWRVKKFKKVA